MFLNWVLFPMSLLLAFLGIVTIGSGIALYQIAGLIFLLCACVLFSAGAVYTKLDEIRKRLDD